MQENPKCLGFGLMRLPMLGEEIDFEQTCRMADRFLEAGGTYFDAAYGYLAGRCEDTLRRAVVERHPRASFTVATKMPAWEIKAPSDVARIFQTQLDRTGAGYFDYYLLHSISKEHYAIYNDNGCWDFIAAKKAEGVVRQIGFSFHDNADLLEEILTAHPEVDFVQLQINYADWESESIQSRLCYETARRHGKKIVVMEPVKGGLLSSLSDSARAELRAVRPDDSPAAWALRFAASLDGVLAVLSGMSTMEQMEENLRVFSPLAPMTDSDRAALARALAILQATPTVPCTNCRYCMEKCPRKLPIPHFLRFYNRRLVYAFDDRGGYDFAVRQADGVRASDCIACGVCEGRCPQHIGVIDLMKKVAEIFD